MEATITAEVTTITITVEVTAETKVKVDSIVEVVVVANIAVDIKTTAEAVKEVRLFLSSPIAHASERSFSEPSFVLSDFLLQNGSDGQI